MISLLWEVTTITIILFTVEIEILLENNLPGMYLSMYLFGLCSALTNDVALQQKVSQV